MGRGGVWWVWFIGVWGVGDGWEVGVWVGDGWEVVPQLKEERQIPHDYDHSFIHSFIRE